MDSKDALEMKRNHIYSLLQQKNNPGFPLSFSQKGLWFLNQINPNSSSYNLPNVFEIKGPLDIDYLRDCFLALIKRHEALRIHFPRQSYQHQIIRPFSDFNEWNIYEIDNTNSTLSEETLEKKIQTILDQPFDLESGFLFRVHLIKRSELYFILIINMHHIISDGWSIKILLHELEKMYCNKITEQPITLPDIVSYQQYCKQNQSWPQSKAYQEAQEFWKKNLGSVASMQILIPDFYHDNAQPAMSRQLQYNFDFAKDGLLSHFAQKKQISLFTLILSTLHLTLCRYSAAKECTIALPVANRTDTAYLQTVGLFVNTLLFHLKNEEPHTFSALFLKVQRLLDQILRHQVFPFEKLVEMLAPERSPDTNPLFQVMLVQVIPSDPFRLEHCEIQQRPVKTNTAKCDLTFYFIASEAEPAVIAEYNGCLFSEETIKNVMHYWQNILQQAIFTENDCIKSATLTTKDKILTSQWSEGKILPLDEKNSLISCFERQARTHPNKTILCYHEWEVSYQELNNWANNIVDTLYKHAIPKGAIIGLCFNQGISRIAALLAILKIGAIYLPIDPDTPKDRFELIVAQTGLQYLLTNVQFQHCDHFQGLILSINATIPREQAPLPLPVDIKVDDCCYIIFTSGSSGTAKGVRGTYRGLLNRLLWQHETYPFQADEVCLHQAAPTFVDSIAEIFGPLILGNPAIILPEKIRQDPKLFCQFIEKNKITRLLLIPSLLKQLLLASKNIQKSLASLRFISVSGEPLSRELCQLFFTLLPDKKLINIYGSSEVAADVLFYEMTSVPNWASIPLGKPLSNTKIHILDETLEPLPIGVIGEIYVEGFSVAQGYINNPIATDMSFIISPFNHKSILYKTGDFGRFLCDGNIAFYGRKDSQIKIRGKRIDLQEIEATISQYPKIKECLVLCRTLPFSHMVAYLIPQEAQRISKEELVLFLRQKLMDYMLPTQFLILNQFPKTHTGKIDRQALLALNTHIDETKRPEVLSELEQVIYNLWQEKLPPSIFFKDDNFFELGGHSLLLIEVRNHLEQLLKQEIKIIELLRYPTIRSLATFLESKTKTSLVREKEQGIEKNPQSEAIAIIGMSGRFPGADDIDTFFNNLLLKKSGLNVLTEDTLSPLGKQLQARNPKAFVPVSGSLNDIEKFDAELFNIKPKDAEILDPQHRILLECAFETFEQAAYNPLNYRGKIGAYVGASQNTYLFTSLLNRMNPTDPMQLFSLATSNNENYIATRLGYTFNLRGPCVSIQTACSTSLVAIHTACSALLAGECDMALAGGVTVKVPQDLGYIYQSGSIASPDGQCKTLDDGADGTVFANGAGIVLLKQLEQAEKDGDNILAIIRGSAINNDGKEKLAYSAPSIEGQIDVIKTALEKASCSSQQISYVEMHGTGTSLGDLTELEALKEVFKENERCYLGSVKSNIGHLDAASGIAGLFKVIKAMQTKIIPANLNIEKINAQFDWKNSPFQALTTNQKWSSSKGPLRAGLSSFGIGGTNAHLILEERQQSIPSETDDKPYLIILSAHHPQALIEMKKRLSLFLQENANVHLGDLSYTLAIGRRAFKYRFAYICASHKEAVEALSKESPLYQNKSDHRLKEKLTQLAKQWLEGFDVDWTTIFTARKFKRITLPTYPFQKKKYWVEPQFLFLHELITDTKTENLTTRDTIDNEALEQMILEIWQAILGVEHISIEDNFFDLGGNSLLASQITTWVKNYFSIDFSLEQFFMQPTIRCIAELIQKDLGMRTKKIAASEIDCLLEYE